MHKAAKAQRKQQKHNGKQHNNTHEEKKAVRASAGFP
jgi:hypothetical protein